MNAYGTKKKDALAFLVISIKISPRLAGQFSGKKRSLVKADDSHFILLYSEKKPKLFENDDWIDFVDKTFRKLWNSMLSFDIPAKLHWTLFFLNIQ